MKNVADTATSARSPAPPPDTLHLTAHQWMFEQVRVASLKTASFAHASLSAQSTLTVQVEHALVALPRTEPTPRNLPCLFACSAPTPDAVGTARERLRAHGHIFGKPEARRPASQLVPNRANAHTDAVLAVSPAIRK